MTVKIKKKILVVEDDLPIVQAIEDILLIHDLDPTAMTNGRLALDYLEAKAKENALPDLLLVDLMMPVMDGHLLINKIRDHAIDKLKYIPVLLMSAMPELESTAVSLGYEYIRKPPDYDALIEKVLRLSGASRLD